MAKKENSAKELGSGAEASYLDEKGKVVDFTQRVKLVALEGAKFHKVGEEFEAGHVLANKIIADGHAEKV